MLAIDMEGETAIERQQRAGAERVVLHQKDRDISTTWDPGTPYEFYPTEKSYSGKLALGFRVNREHRPAGANEKSKFEINISRHDDDRLNQIFGGQYILDDSRERFLGFAFRMDETYEQPVRWLLHMQIWQCCSNGTQPPLTFQALPQASADNETIHFILLKRTDANLRNPPRSDNGERLRFEDGKDFVALKKGQWYRLVFGLKPKPQADSDANTGILSLWINGQPVLKHLGPWGYTPRASEDIVNAYAVKVGVYRAAQDTMQQFAIDAIRWATTFEAADPDHP
jgi:hypothetical protein